jgi:hypothetical protein
MKKSKETTPHLYGFDQSMGLSGSPLGSKSTDGWSVVRCSSSRWPSKGCVSQHRSMLMVVKVNQLSKRKAGLFVAG